MAATVGERVYLVRLALGDGVRSPLAMQKFAALVTDRAGGARRYDPSIISNIETGKRAVALDEVEVFASLDPMARGRDWLAFGPPAEPPAASAIPPGTAAPIQMGGRGETPRVAPARGAAAKRRRDQAG